MGDPACDRYPSLLCGLPGGARGMCVCGMGGDLPVALAILLPGGPVTVQLLTGDQAVRALAVDFG